MARHRDDEGDKFEVTWEVDDGYVNNGPHSFTASAEDIEDCDTAAEMRERLWYLVEQDFHESVHYVCGDEAAFVEWALAAKQRLDAAAKEEGNENPTQ